jgi:prophage maintenance system killer protein
MKMLGGKKRFFDMARKINNQQLVIYQSPAGAIELRGDVSKETIWATQAQMAVVFGVNSQAITKHLKNIYAEGELFKGATCSKMEQVQIEGNRKVRRAVEFYNLDAIISVGYRISSTMGTKFRQWATRTLREHILKGYTINKKRIGKNYASFMKAVESVHALLPVASKLDKAAIFELIKTFADTWFSLDAYDKGKFVAGRVTKKKVEVAADELLKGIAELKKELMKKDEATNLFAMERGGSSVAGVVGNILQTFGGKDLYPSIEEKAAHLLYFMVKNHPFADGNKRSGAFAFVWFLRRAGVLDTRRLTPQALTALTLLIAESHPKDKDKMAGLVTMLLRK